MVYGISESDLNAMISQPDVLNIRLSIIKDRHQACPKVNYIVHSTSILYGIRIIIPLIMYLHNLSKQTETATQFSAVSILFKKLFKIHAILVRTESARIQGRNPYVRNKYIRGGQGIMRVLFRTELFYHSTDIFTIVPSVTLDGPQLPRESKKRHKDLPHVSYQFVTLSNISSCNSITANAFFRVVMR